MNTTEKAHAAQTLKGFRRAAVWTIIVSLVIAAGIGIATIVSGNFGELQGKVLLTTLAVAAFAVLALCHLAVLGRDVKIIGWIGIGTSVIALAAAVTLIWWNYNTYEAYPGQLYMTITKIFTTATLLAVSFAHANLMLLLASTPVRWMRIALDLNLVFIGIVPLLVIPIILTEGTFPPASLSDVYWRFFGVVMILDALGTVALPVTSLIIRGQRKAAGLDGETVDQITMTVRDETAEWIAGEAKKSNTTPLAVVEKLVLDARGK